MGRRNCFFHQRSHFSKQNLKAELDPSSKTRIVPIIENNLEPIKSEIETSKNMQALKDSAFQMGLDWSFRGLNVSVSRIQQIIRSVDNSVDVFKVSSERLLNEMAKDPDSSDDQLSFAITMDSNYKNEAQKSLILADELSYSTFENEVFNQTIQKKISIDEFKRWNYQFNSIKDQINKYSKIHTMKTDLVALSVKWLKNGEASQADLSGIYAALNNSIDPFTESTKQLISDLSQSLNSNKEALEFAGNLSAEYKQLAISIRTRSVAAEYESWGQSFFRSVLQERPGIEQLRKWYDLWMSAFDFIQREKARVARGSGSWPEWNMKKVIENAIKESWSAQEFTALETIALVAKSKDSCARHKDMSSLAECANMSLFSKGPKKFFNPSYNGRYTLLGSDFIAYMNGLSGFDWNNLRRTLLNEFFGSWEPIWSKCDNNLFNQKAATLKGQINAITIAADQFKKWELERQIKETIKNCQ